MADPLRHRQTKGAATDMVDLTPPRHISTLPMAAIRSFGCVAAVTEFLDKTRQEDPPDPAGRAEEIYHRLALDQDLGEIDRRWISGVEPSLRSAVNEFSGR